MPILYGAWRSRATRNLWLAGEIGLPLDHRPVLQASRVASPEAPDAPLNTLSRAFLDISPAGAMPVLDDDGFVLTESLAINLYLARKYGGSLGPADSREDALMEQWALQGATSVEPDALGIQNVYGKGRAGSAEGLAEVEERAERLKRPLRLLNGHLAREGFMVGGRFTVADINMAEIVRYAKAHPTLLPGYSALSDWLATCQDRPAFKAMWAAREAEPL